MRDLESLALRKDLALAVNYESKIPCEARKGSEGMAGS